MKIKPLTILLITLLPVFFLSGCGNGTKGDLVTGQYYNPAADTAGVSKNAEKDPEDAHLDKTSDKNDDPSAESVSGTESAADLSQPVSSDLFMIMTNDMQGECLILEQLASGKQYMYYYTLATQFLNKYGDRETVSSFDSGRVVTIGAKDSQGRVTQVQISDQVWEYPDVTRYSVDEKHGVFKIADTKYAIEDDLYVNSDGAKIALSDLTELDALRIIGIDKKLISISVTTGHGELELKNTDLFEGSFIQVGDRIFSEITKNMKMEIPEGTYTVTVANKGYGGSTDVTIEKGQKKVLDLDSLKGEGPKFGNILFAIDVAGATLKIDGRIVDYSEAIPLQYGIHVITVTADTYEDYSKKLFVNSKEATIVIGLSGEDTKSSSETSSEKKEAETDTETATQGGQAGSLAGSLAGNLAGGSTGTDSSTSGSSASGSAGNSQGSSESTNGSTTEKEIGDIVNGITSGGTGDSTADYLSTLSELLSALGKTED